LSLNLKYNCRSSQDIRSKFITPAIVEGGWDLLTQIREEVTFTQGKVIVRGKLVSRGKAKRADYILYYKPKIPIAVIEAKDNKHTVGAGMQQALEYGAMLDVPFVYSSNGDSFLEHDRTKSTGKIENEMPLESFPSPDDLWQRYRIFKGIDDKVNAVVNQEYHDDGSGKTPRYYQHTAFQIIWRLWKSRTKKRILFLADRNILVDQTRTNDFKPFGSAMTKISKRQVDKSYEIYLSLYQAVTGSEEEKNIYKQFSPDFFDLVIIDECHRGSADAESAWREILTYFSSATHIGLTATLKETRHVSNIHYFGEPLYTYSLKQGIEDGFLAPYKVVRIDFDKDLTGWRPEQGKVDKYGYEIEDRIYNQKDFDKNLVLEKRTELAAKKVSEFLKATDRYDKTIIFCEDIDHAERMRKELVNENPDLVKKDRRYVMRITGDSIEGKNELYNFTDPESRHPVIATTSKLMSTGVDSQTAKLIVLDQNIQSMVEFKQIIGRGTRINEDFNKYYFTIMDFKKATELFADPDFDGDPVQIYEPGPNETPVPPDDDQPVDVDEEEIIIYIEDDEIIIDPEGGESPRKYYVHDVPVFVVAERVQYYGKDGKLITESLRDYTRKTVKKEFASLDDFLRRWDSASKKQAIIQELEDQGVLFEPLADEVGKNFGPFDLICHVAYGQPPLTRKERAENVKKRNYFAEYGEKARLVLESLLDKYADEGVENMEDINVLKLQPINQHGTPIEIIKSFGGKEKYLEALKELENQIYQIAS